MAIVTIEDVYGEFDCMMFPKTYEKFAEVLDTDRIVHIGGKISVRVGEKPIILIEKIDFLDEKPVEQIASDNETQVFGEEKKKEVKISKMYMQFNINDKELVETICEILSSYPGKSPVFVQCDRKLFNLNVCVEPSSTLVAEISAIIGGSNIKII